MDIGKNLSYLIELQKIVFIIISEIINQQFFEKMKM
jgi:hypothetical protein